MTISLTMRVPQHCAALVTTIANPKSDNPTMTEQTYNPGSTAELVVYDGQDIRIAEIAAPAAAPVDVDSVAADQSAQARGGEAPTPEAEEAERRAEQEQDDTFDDDSDGDDEDEDDDLK